MLTADMQQRGEHLWNALELTATAWREAKAMLDELSELFHLHTSHENSH